MIKNTVNVKKLNFKNTILHLGPLPPTIGGITTFIVGIIRSDLIKKYNLFTFGTERPTFNLVRKKNDYTLIYQIGLFRLIKSIIWTTSHVISFPFYLVKTRPKIVHIHASTYWSFWENSLYVLISKIFSIKTIIHIHGAEFDVFYNSSSKIIKYIIRKSLFFCDKIIVLSPKWKKFFLGLIPENKIIVLENFVNQSTYLLPKTHSSSVEDVVKVFFLGGVSAKRKGIYDVLKAIPIVVKEYENILFTFSVSSNIEEFTGFARAHARRDVGSHIQFLKSITEEEKIKLLNESDIFLLPSYAEGLPISILEAMAAGLPIITTPVGAIPEVIEANENGFLVDPGDYKALANKILILARDKNLRKKMSKNNLKNIKEKYDINVISEKLDREYEKLL